MTTAEKANSNGNTDEQETPVITGPALKLERLKRAVLEVPVQGITPLISHAWSQKSKALMLEKQTTNTRPKREARNPQEDYENAFYRLEDGRPGMPATAFKAAIVDAARFYEGVTLVLLKRLIFIRGEGSEQLVPIDGTVRMREDAARNANGVADLRYRPEFFPWKTVLQVEYLPNLLTGDSVLALVDASGRNGVGDWRPSSPKSQTGTYGQYEVIT